MIVSIWPETHGDLILDLRYHLTDGTLRPALVAVDELGREREFGDILEVRDGGGHVELTRLVIAEDLGFERDGEKVRIYPVE